MQHGFSIKLMDIIHDHDFTIVAKYMFAGYEIDCLLGKKHPLFQLEIAFNEIWIFLTPKGWGRHLLYFRKKEHLFVLLLYVPVNSYGHGGVSSPNHTFSWASLNKRLISNLCTYFLL